MESPISADFAAYAADPPPFHSHATKAPKKALFGALKAIPKPVFTPTDEHCAASVEFQTPNHAIHAPALLFGKDVCGKCQRQVTAYVFVTDGYRNATYHCPAHGDVPPMRSHIVRPESVKCA
jgi:hypothetical protein